MAITTDDLISRWETLSVDDERLTGLNEYVSLEWIDSATIGRELLCRCEGVVFFNASREIWNTRDGSGLMKLPAGVSATIYKGYYSIT
ncbi:Uncharacterized protein TPAR_01526 [Tolypocladium paradoxum]|uniref:Uncharacterized protein n=1 Tax=Tolypocladium paradoxum TaxID=94208 RepID=A0A2S4L753_9HYPO|nr:Uncharacterized protein TPAR_01526 [Tolypocladium paradoxum]